MSEESNTYRYIDELLPEHGYMLQSFECTDCLCNNSNHFTEYLKWSALSDSASGNGKTFAMFECEDGDIKRIIGFITLKSTSFITSFDRMNVMNGEPAMEIAELAVDKNYIRQGIGDALLMHAFSIAHTIRAEYVGVTRIVVCATKESVDFYSKKKYGFKKISDTYEIPRSIDNENCIGMSVRLKPIPR